VGSDAFASYLSSQMSGGANASDDDDDSDEDTNWLSHDLRHRGGAGGDIESGDGFEDAFSPSAATNAFGTSRRGHNLDDSKDGDDDDDDWGPFADSSSSHTNTGGALSSSAQAYLTPADLAADFQREQSAADAHRFDDVADDASSTMSPFEDGGEGGEDEDQRSEGSNRARSDSGSSENASGTHFVDLLDNASVRAADVVAAAHARRPSLDKLEGVAADTPPRISRPRGVSSGSGDASPSLPASASEDAITPQQPLGPGISPDAQADHQSGMIERTIDGETVKVPLDDIALMAAQKTSTKNDEESAIVDEDD
jgi:SIT4-associating protein SAP185/190